MATEVYLRRTVAALVRSLASLNVQPERAASPAMQAAYHAGYLRALSAVAEALEIDIISPEPDTAPSVQMIHPLLLPPA